MWYGMSLSITTVGRNIAMDILVTVSLTFIYSKSMTVTNCCVKQVTTLNLLKLMRVMKPGKMNTTSTNRNQVGIARIRCSPA